MHKDHIWIVTDVLEHRQAMICDVVKFKVQSLLRLEIWQKYDSNSLCILSLLDCHC